MTFLQYYVIIKLIKLLDITQLNLSNITQLKLRNITQYLNYVILRKKKLHNIGGC